MFVVEAQCIVGHCTNVLVFVLLDDVDRTVGKPGRSNRDGGRREVLPEAKVLVGTNQTTQIEHLNRSILVGSHVGLHLQPTDEPLLPSRVGSDFDARVVAIV